LFKCGYFTSLVPITLKTGPSKIVKAVLSTVFLGDDMVRFVLFGAVVFMEKAIFAPMFGSF
jgi:hypothetical protein